MESSIDSGLSAIVAVEKEQTTTKSRIAKVKNFYFKERLNEFYEISNILLKITYAYSMALTPSWGFELCPARPPKYVVYSFIPLWASIIFILVGSPTMHIPFLIFLFFNYSINRGAPIHAVSSSKV